MDEKQQMIEFLKSIMSDELIEIITNFSWKLFLKLKEKGFTEKQAIDIVCTFAKTK